MIGISAAEIASGQGKEKSRRQNQRGIVFANVFVHVQRNGKWKQGCEMPKPIQLSIILFGLKY